ncbi:nuclear transport factor 2 family protein [Streptomyces sp. NBC_01351]|uniref:nuclear transport factor 2 family protein n=1 Tax=Streptomyces sp. NBC_01351 TaxID=2903833 RepID=UPI002E341913|nr:nuclear transport factor 2 family protein [Streptomyces sp. NBC_01351]
MTAISHAGADLFAGHAEDSPEAAAIARVIRHFDLIDTGDVASMVFLFAPDAIYHRPGHEPFLGRSGIRDFYTRIRPIRSGRHSLETAIAHGRNVSVHGAFRGVLHDGSPVDLRFSDFFVVDGEGAFLRRDTFVFAPH